MVVFDYELQIQWLGVVIGGYHIRGNAIRNELMYHINANLLNVVNTGGDYREYNLVLVIRNADDEILKSIYVNDYLNMDVIFEKVLLESVSIN